MVEQSTQYLKSDGLNLADAGTGRVRIRERERETERERKLTDIQTHRQAN